MRSTLKGKRPTVYMALGRKRSCSSKKRGGESKVRLNIVTVMPSLYSGICRTRYLVRYCETTIPGISRSRILIFVRLEVLD